MRIFQLNTAQKKIEFTPWYPRGAKPRRKGYYEVRNSRLVHWRHTLVGRPTRYWDGSNWRIDKGDRISIFGRHDSHQWRGLISPMKWDTFREKRVA